MSTLIALVILSVTMLTSAAPSPGIHIHTAAYGVHSPVVHHVPVYHDAYAYHAPIVTPVVHPVPVVHQVEYHHPYVQPVAYKVKTHYHLFGK